MSQVRMIQAVFEEPARERLFGLFPPKFSNKTLKDDQFLHHVTLFFSRKPIEITDDAWATKVAYWANEGDEVTVQFNNLVWSDSFGVEAVTVTLINSSGEILESPPGKTWHVTISTEGKPPVESNTLLNSIDNSSMRAESQKLNNIKTVATIKHYK